MATISTWYEAYSRIAELLDKFYSKNKENTAKALYSRLRDSNYAGLNKSLFQNGSEIREQGLDPIQIFASFNYPRVPNATRIRAINSLFNKLDSDDSVSGDVVFEGIPTPVITRIVYFRGWDIQNRIWAVFHRVKEEGINGLLDNSFEILENWYGVDIASFTIFLFWVNSEEFLPLDKNTVKFLIANDIIKATPRTVNMYRSLCKGKTISYINDPLERKEVFRRIVNEAYGFSDSKSQEFPLSGTTASIISSKYEESKSKKEIEEKVQKDNRTKSIDSQRSFKIIAIRPLFKEGPENKNEKQKHLKNLVEGQLYQFHHEYIFDDSSDKAIKYDERKEISLYDYIDQSTGKKIKISISSVVGKNGSGKSTIVELIYLMANKISYIKGIETSEDLFDEEIFADLFIHSDRLYKISFGEKITIHFYNLNPEGDIYTQDPKELNFAEFDIESFCYSVVMNYSLYGLNTKIMGDWIHPLFHKNDSYQVPIVLNPLRNEGIIDVNNEEHLTKSRLLSNILEPDRINFESKEVPEIVPGKVPDALVLKIDKDKMKRKREYYKKKYDISEDREIDKQQVSKVIMQFGVNDVSADKYVDECKEYIFLKLDSIAENYSKFHKFKELTRWVDEDEAKLKDYCEELNRDDSHITFKLKQAINYLKYDIYTPKENSSIIDFALAIKRLRTQAIINRNQENEKTESSNSRLRTIDLMPPSFFEIEIHFKGAGEFSELSSGEKQQIFSTSSVTYQLLNLSSVERQLNSLKYSNVNIVFDEVELYFHPEMQQSYIKKLMDSISRLVLDEIDNINIIFVTHSPFILSDIPSNNLLLLEQKRGKSYPKKQMKETFGANIHDLLADEFFMNKGFMGEFAKGKIKETIVSLRYQIIEKKLESYSDRTPIEKDEEMEINLLQVEKRNMDSNRLLSQADCKNIIRLVGEPLLFESLMEMYIEAYPEDIIDH